MIEEIDIYEHPENLGKRIGNEYGEHGAVKLGKPPLECVLLDRVNKLIVEVNKLIKKEESK